MNITHHSNPDLEINHYLIDGKVSPSDIIIFLNKKLREPNHNNAYNILVDVRKTKFINIQDGLTEFAKYVKEDSENWPAHRKCALLTSKPIDVVNATLLKYNVDKLKPKLGIEIFSTEEAAYRWLSVY